MTQQLGETRKDALFYVGAAQACHDRAQTAEKSSHDQRFLLDSALIFSNLAIAMATIEANDIATARD